MHIFKFLDIDKSFSRVVIWVKTLTSSSYELPHSIFFLTLDFVRFKIFINLASLKQYLPFDLILWFPQLLVKWLIFYCVYCHDSGTLSHTWGTYYTPTCHLDCSYVYLQIHVDCYVLLSCAASVTIRHLFEKEALLEIAKNNRCWWIINEWTMKKH